MHLCLHTAAQCARQSHMCCQGLYVDACGNVLSTHAHDLGCIYRAQADSGMHHGFSHMPLTNATHTLCLQSLTSASQQSQHRIDCTYPMASQPLHNTQNWNMFCAWRQVLHTTGGDHQQPSSASGLKPALVHGGMH